MTKEIFLYDLTTNQQWSEFADQIEQDLTNSNFNSNDNINSKWDTLHNSIYNSAKNNVPNKTVTTQENRVKHLKEINESIKYLRKTNRILKKLIKFKYITNKEFLNRQWIEKDMTSYMNIVHFLQLDNTLPPVLIDNENIDILVKLCKVMLKLLRLHLNNSSKKEIQHRIKQLVEKRYSDYKENLG